VKLLQLSALECVQELHQAIAQNPFLEESAETPESSQAARKALRRTARMRDLGRPRRNRRAVLRSRLSSAWDRRLGVSALSSRNRFCRNGLVQVSCTHSSADSWQQLHRLLQPGVRVSCCFSAARHHYGVGHSRNPQLVIHQPRATSYAATSDERQSPQNVLPTRPLQARIPGEKLQRRVKSAARFRAVAPKSRANDMTTIHGHRSRFPRAQAGELCCGEHSSIATFWRVARTSSIGSGGRPAGLLPPSRVKP